MRVVEASTLRRTAPAHAPGERSCSKEGLAASCLQLLVSDLGFRDWSLVFEVLVFKA